MGHRATGGILVIDDDQSDESTGGWSGHRASTRERDGESSPPKGLIGEVTLFYHARHGAACDDA
jgi:hypothetical protein